MERDDIEKAADYFAYENWTGGGFEVASSNSFIAGANWRIGCVWHDARKGSCSLWRILTVLMIWSI